MKNTISLNKFLWVLALALFASCTKTEYLEYEQQPLNKIIEFKITNSTQELYGAIDNNENTIRLYVPFYLGVDFLTPSITLETGAILVDEEGNEINLDGGVDPIAIGDTAYYHVRSADSVTRHYTFIQQYLPFSEALTAGYTTSMIDSVAKAASVTQYINIYGNFASTSTNARFTFTNKETGVEYKNFTRVVSMSPSEAYYTMVTEIVPEAIAGEYEVSVEHQGRSTKLPDMNLTYSMPYPTFFSSSASYAIGDTITFTPSYATAGGGGVYLDLDRIYLRILNTATVPAGFNTDLYGTEIEFEIASVTRREVKIIVPETLATGVYGSTSNAMVFYFDYAESTGWAKGVRTGVVSTQFLITPKSE
ncbi:hypothetical protein [Sphingobacterium sp. LRF_L2]|uniref:hypothetical protein n=1 Tax=Sphingobacterium sp. LRF_L2 TaxID=3369421 RepID=UPI003F610D09